MARRRAARTDANQTEVISAFRDEGCSVADTSDVGEGFLDIVVGLDGINVLVEIKDGSKPPSARKLTEPQRKFTGAWAGWWEVVKDLDEVRSLVLRMRQRSAGHQDGEVAGPGPGALESRVEDARGA